MQLKVYYSLLTVAGAGLPLVNLGCTPSQGRASRRHPKNHPGTSLVFTDLVRTLGVRVIRLRDKLLLLIDRFLLMDAIFAVCETALVRQEQENT